jgi:hypothetical protein
MEADHLGKIHGCSGGKLTLDASSLRFTCPSNRSKDVTARVDEVKKTTKNGVELQSGEEYNFSVGHKDSIQTQKLFCLWLSQTKPGACYSKN